MLNLLPLSAALLALFPMDPRGRSEVPDFSTEVRPILEARCFHCHGPGRQSAGLRLDRADAALAGSFFGQHAVIVPGEPGQSDLVRRLRTADPDQRMPKGRPPLPPEELEVLVRWIESGASFGGTPVSQGEPSDWVSHWSYRPVGASESPPATWPDWERGPLDRFVSRALADRGAEPAPPADRGTLLRRASLDLTGLPPTLDALDAFLADEDPGAFGRALERLFGSSAYAEHQARQWLDLARYADSQGYEKDDRRTMWRYRDWVIEAYAKNLPFDRFTVSQLAGDLLPEPTLDDLVATGFHRNTMVNREGGTDPEEFRVAAVKDRVHTTAAVWLGTTLECAQCHDHKYDPFTTEDYYGLYAFFDSTADEGNSDEPTIEAPRSAELERKAALEARRDELRSRLSTWTPELEAQFEVWRLSERAALSAWRVSRPVGAQGEEGTRLAMLEDGSLLAFGPLPDRDVYRLRLEVPAGRYSSLSLEVLTDESLPDGGPGRPSHRNFVLSEVELTRNGEPLGLNRGRADWYQKDRPWPGADVADGRPETGWAIGGAQGQDHRLVLDLEEPAVFGETTELELALSQQYGGGHLIGRLRVAFSAEAAPALPPVPPALEGALADEAEPEPRRELARWFLERAPALDAARTELAEIEGQLVFPRALVLRERDEPRDTRILERGSHLSPGDPIQPDTPHLLPALSPRGERPDRLDLARWLVSPENPLVARVVVNREWERFFGRGLVETSADFGLQGEAPTHPELLDWLASEFRASGWDLRALQRTILDSATYAQDSRVTPGDLERDPANRWLGRGPRHRLDAEVLRDQALAISGLLDTTVGGPSVFPPQPEGTWTMTYSGDAWQAARDGNRWRRGLYTFWRRTAPYPTYLLLDATSRELACTRRARTNTPLQALALLNDPAFVECAVEFARRLVAEASGTDARLELGFRLCVARPPSPGERAVLTRLFEDERASYRADPAAARALAGSEVLPLDDGHDPVELAAWTVVCNVLLNLDETLTKE